MPRQTLDFGIDLGTTNSAIAMMEGIEPVIIKNNQGQDTTPSAVGFTKNGVLRLGEAARRVQLAQPQDAYTEFKRRMGSDEVYDFRSSGKRLKPEELSAEVLKSLKGDVEQSRGERVDAAVITVPAAFELHQCEATQRAGALAGFSTTPLLQEPVAAALAYGFQRDQEKGYWLVYDFGGGTFDAALIRAEEGIIQVAAHEGDNFLGGSDIDWAIFQHLLLPRLTEQFDLPDFRRGNPRWEVAVQKLKASIEKAKIEASRNRRAPLMECLFEDAAGTEVDLELLGLELAQEDIARIAEPVISKSINQVKRLLAGKGLAAHDVARTILVGGPTLAPYFRAQLQAELGTSVDFSVDPMTVVACGAAVFAGTQPLTSKVTVAVPEGTLDLALKYKPVGADADPLVGGRVLAGPGGCVNHTIELTNASTGWTSGQVPVNADGTFALTLAAERNVRNEYRIALRNAAGQPLKTAPESIHYTIGAAVEEQPLIHSIGVALANNKTRQYFQKGAGLPQKCRNEHRTATLLVAGDKESRLRIPVVEGESPHSDRNRLIGYMEIRGDQIRRDVPADQEIQVTLKMDESRDIVMEVYVPYLDEEFTTRLSLGRKAAANSVEFLLRRLTNENSRRQTLRRKADEAEERAAAQIITDLEHEISFADLEKRIREAEGDFVTCEQCDKLLLEAACRLDEADALIKWPALVKNAKRHDTSFYELARACGTPADLQTAEELNNRLQECIRSKNPVRLEALRDEAWRLVCNLRHDYLPYWEHHFEWLELQVPTLSSPDEARHSVLRGRHALAEKNLPRLRSACHELWKFFPDEAEQYRGLDAGIT